MSAITSTRFESLLDETKRGSIGALDAKFREAVSQAVAYCVFQASRHGNTAPLTRLAAAVPAFMSAAVLKIKKVPSGKARTDLDVWRDCHKAADYFVAVQLASREQRAAMNAAKRDPNKPKAARKAPVTTTVQTGLIINGEAVTINEQEAALLAEYLTQLRMTAQIKLAA